jgi:hypothetical protein
MSLSERSRAAIYQGLSEVLPSQAVEEMLSYFPARDVEEPVTKEFLHAELALVRIELHTELRRMQAWMIGTAATLGGVLIGAMALLR